MFYNLLQLFSQTILAKYFVLNQSRHQLFNFLLTWRNPVARFVTLLAQCCLSLSVLACSPTYDWRTIRLAPQDQGLSLDFPSKPSMAQKAQTLNAQSITMTQSASLVNTSQFALASVPAPNEAAAKALAMAMAQGFAINLQTTPAAPKTIALAQTAGAFEQRYQTAQFAAQARFIWTSGAAYQLIAIGPAADLNAEAADQFIRSIRFE